MDPYFYSLSQSAWKRDIVMGASWASIVREEHACHFDRFDSLSVSIPIFVNLETSSAIAFIGGQNTPGQKSTAIISDLILM